MKNIGEIEMTFMHIARNEKKQAYPGWDSCSFWKDVYIVLYPKETLWTGKFLATNFNQDVGS